MGERADNLVGIYWKS